MIFLLCLFLIAAAFCLIPYLSEIFKKDADVKKITKKYLYKVVPITMLVIFILSSIGENAGK